MNNSPWAKLTTSMIPKIKVRPEATSARIMPVTMPFRVWINIWSNGMACRNSILEPEILMDHGIVDPKRRGRRVVPNHPLFEKIDALAGFEGQRHVLLDQ